MTASIQTEPVFTVFIGLGSNLENPVQQIRTAIDTIKANKSINLVKTSSLYKTAPVGPDGQPDYINAVVEVQTTMQPEALLSALQSIENQHGRKRELHWGARTLDLDILLFDEQVISQPNLVIPHAHIAERNFVLIPLLEITDDSLMIPGKGQLNDLLQQCRDNAIEKLDI